jgi:two-component system copper resistance phosphate regulon response regulator CusR
VRILVAEDDQVTSQTVCAMVRGLGHRPMQAFDAMQTLMLAMREPQPDAILLDLNMPGGTGLGALERLRASSKTAHIPVVVLSGSMDPDARRAALDAGAAEFIGKPATTQQLKTALEALAERR